MTETIFEKAQLFLTLLLTKLTKRLANMANHIWISIALTLSPRKYFNGKFCFSCLNKLWKALHNLFYGKQKIMQRSIIKHTHNQPFNQFTLQYHFA